MDVGGISKPAAGDDDRDSNFRIFIFIFTLAQVKTALDMEIAVNRQLLETEEDRLGIKPFTHQVKLTRWTVRSRT